MYDAPANNQTRTSKLSAGEYAVHIVLILISAVIAFRVMSVFRHGAAPIGAAIITPSVMSLFNARRRTGEILDGYRCSAYGIRVFDVCIYNYRST